MSEGSKHEFLVPVPSSNIENYFSFIPLYRTVRSYFEIWLHTMYRWSAWRFDYSKIVLDDNSWFHARTTWNQSRVTEYLREIKMLDCKDTYLNAIPENHLRKFHHESWRKGHVYSWAIAIGFQKHGGTLGILEIRICTDSRLIPQVGKEENFVCYWRLSLPTLPTGDHISVSSGVPRVYGDTVRRTFHYRVSWAIKR